MFKLIRTIEKSNSLEEIMPEIGMLDGHQFVLAQIGDKDHVFSMQNLSLGVCNCCPGRVEEDVVPDKVEVWEYSRMPD